jgi:hypothetical protein
VRAAIDQWPVEHDERKATSLQDVRAKHTNCFTSTTAKAMPTKQNA